MSLRSTRKDNLFYIPRFSLASTMSMTHPLANLLEDIRGTSTIYIFRGWKTFRQVNMFSKGSRDPPKYTLKLMDLSIHRYIYVLNLNLYSTQLPNCTGRYAPMTCFDLFCKFISTSSTHCCHRDTAHSLFSHNISISVWLQKRPNERSTSYTLHSDITGTPVCLLWKFTCLLIMEIIFLKIWLF